MAFWSTAPCRRKLALCDEQYAAKEEAAGARHPAARHVRVIFPQKLVPVVLSYLARSPGRARWEEHGCWRKSRPTTPRFEVLVNGRCVGSVPNRALAFKRSRTTSGATCAYSRIDPAIA